MITNKLVRYYCPGCRQTIDRSVPRANKYRTSYCERMGKQYRMRKLKVQL